MKTNRAFLTAQQDLAQEISLRDVDKLHSVGCSHVLCFNKDPIQTEALFCQVLGELWWSIKLRNDETRKMLQIYV